MKFEIVQASIEYKEILANLFQFYYYDFSEFEESDVEEDGRFEADPYLDNYWIEVEHRFPYILIKDGKYIGFVLVRFIEEQKCFSIAEFFVMKKYRRERIGREAAIQIFNFYKGYWEVAQLESNKPAQAFWIKVIDDFTKGHFTDRVENEKRIQNFVS
jgi:predicted acetyltransferase